MINRIPIYFFYTSSLILLIAGIFILLGARVNHTDSLPVGLYWSSSKSPAKGDLIEMCPPNTAIFKAARSRQYIGVGFCPDRFEPMFKKLVGVAGDTISIDETGVTVNGTKLKNSKPVKYDNVGNPLPALNIENYQLKPGEVLLMSNYSTQSFDARYFGPISSSQIQHVIKQTPFTM